MAATKALAEIQARLFGTTRELVGTKGLRDGLKYLRAPLQGPNIMKYIPMEIFTGHLLMRDLTRQGEFWDEDKERHKTKNIERKLAGKGKPKKGEGRRTKLAGKKKK